MATALAELASNYEAYQAATTYLNKRWGQLQTAHALIRQLEKNHNARPSQHEVPRFWSQDW